MGKRREGRECSVQFLYSHDLNKDELEDDLERFWGIRRTHPEARKFANDLIRGVLEHLVSIDAVISERLENFRMERVSTVDKNIIRVAIFEMLHVQGTPGVVALNEAIEIAKRFGAEHSWRFVNGILDRVLADIKKNTLTVSE